MGIIKDWVEKLSDDDRELSSDVQTVGNKVDKMTLSHSYIKDQVACIRGCVDGKQVR